MLTLWHSSATGQTQGKDSDGKSVFDYYKVKDFRFQTGVNDPVELTYAFTRRPWRYVDLAKDTITMKKKPGIVLGGSLLNSSKQLNLGTLSDSRFGGKFTAGYQVSIDSIFKDLKPYGGTWSAGVYGSIAYDNLLIYDPTDSTCSVQTPRTTSITLSGVHFRPQPRSGSFYWMVAGTITCERGWNKDAMRSYVDLAKATVTPNAVGFKKTDGSFGTLVEDQYRGRIAASLPVYWGKWTALPYGSITWAEMTTPIYRWGLQAGFTNKKLDYQAMSLPSAFVVGVDWASGHDIGFSDWNVYLTGSFKL